MNKELRKAIVDMIVKAGEGHIPSSFSIIDIISVLYDRHLKFNPKKTDWDERDYFVLSKGHGCAALNVVLQRHGFISQNDIDNCGKFNAILSGHPDRTKVPGVEASTGSLGHGFPYSVGIALGQKIFKKTNKVYVLIGDGESHEGSVWESVLVAQNMKLDNLCCIVDYNGSAAQILPHPDIAAQWTAFGWTVTVIDGHSSDDINRAFEAFKNNRSGKPFVIIARTVKGKGVSFLETHGPWHHKIPNEMEYKAIMEELEYV